MIQAAKAEIESWENKSRISLLYLLLEQDFPIWVISPTGGRYQVLGRRITIKKNNGGRLEMMVGDSEF